MAFKIDKRDAKRIEDLADRLGEQREGIDNLIDVINEFIADRVGDLNLRIVDYNDTLGEARGVIEDIHSQADSDYQDKSEKWQDGERGSITKEWIEAVESIKDNDLNDISEFDIDECEIKLSDEVEDHKVILTENLEHEPNY
jgi:hypothetical protein